MAEKTEKPTSKKQKDSAKKGQAFKSKDLITTVILIIGNYYLAHYMSLSDFSKFYLTILSGHADLGVSDYLTGLMTIYFKISLPFIALCVIVGFAVTCLQTRFILATDAIKLNFKALNPVEGMKKIFNMRTVKDFVKSFLYLIIFIITCYKLVHDDLRQVLTLYRSDIAGLTACWISLAFRSFMAFMEFSVLILILDLLIEYFLHFKDIKMEKYEVKQENKETDGNPEIKSARRRIHQEILNGEEMAAIRNSEVVMANPTHIAVAIYFNIEMASLPFISLRCANAKARAAIAYAEKIGIPVVRNIPLARRLYHKFKRYTFISLNDDILIEVMDVLIWLKRIEMMGTYQDDEKLVTDLPKNDDEKLDDFIR